jgi:uncharacterized protein (TIGR03083 family)
VITGPAGLLPYASAMDVRGMLAQEQRDLVGLLRTLSGVEWEMPSLCAGWRVRDVVGHLVSTTVPLAGYLNVAVRRGSVDRVNKHLVDQTRVLATATLIDRFEASIGRGWATTLVPAVMLADSVVHHQDIRRPLGRTRTVPADRLVAVLNRPDPFARPRRRARGLRFVATDVNWAKGEGLEVRGTGEAIALAVAGRPVVLDELDGNGVALLRQRIGRA